MTQLVVALENQIEIIVSISESSAQCAPSILDLTQCARGSLIRNRLSADKLPALLVKTKRLVVQRQDSQSLSPLGFSC